MERSIKMMPSFKKVGATLAAERMNGKQIYSAFQHNLYS